MTSYRLVKRCPAGSGPVGVNSPNTIGDGYTTVGYRYNAVLNSRYNTVITKVEKTYELNVIIRI